MGGHWPWRLIGFVRMEVGLRTLTGIRRGGVSPRSDTGSWVFLIVFSLHWWFANFILKPYLPLYWHIHRVLFFSTTIATRITISPLHRMLLSLHCRFLLPGQVASCVHHRLPVLSSLLETLQFFLQKLIFFLQFLQEQVFFIHFFMFFSFLDNSRRLLPRVTLDIYGMPFRLWLQTLIAST